jgi:hypothetical protein
MSARLRCALRFTRSWCRLAGLAAWLAVALVCPAVPAVEFAALVEEAAEQEYEPTPRVNFDPNLSLAQAIGDPAIETVEEMTVGASPGSGRTVSPGDDSFMSQLGQRMANIQDPAIETVDEQTKKHDHTGEKHWYDDFNIRGYTQFRINSTLWNNPEGAPVYHPNDKSVGLNNPLLHPSLPRHLLW